jgi:hypothetical protein
MSTYEYNDEWEEREYSRRDIERSRYLKSSRNSGPAQDRYSTHQSSSYRRSAPRHSPPERSQSLPRLYASVPPRVHSSAYRRYPSSRIPKISISTTLSDSDDSLDSLSPIEVSEEEDEISSEEFEEESEEEVLRYENEESGDEVEEMQQRWDKLSTTAPSDRSHVLSSRTNHGSSSNWLNVHHPAHSVSAPTSPMYRSSTRSLISPSPIASTRSQQGSPPRGPPRPPRIIIGSDGERDSDESSSDGMPYFSSSVPSNIPFSNLRAEYEPREVEEARQRRDRRIVHPKKWLERLQLLEAEVVVNSALSDFELPLASPQLNDVGGEILRDSKVIKRVLGNIVRMQEKNYCGSAINALIIHSQRPGVANLQPIQDNDIRRLLDVYDHFLEGPGAGRSLDAMRLLEHCFAFLEGHLLDWPSMRRAIRERQIEDDEILYPGLLYVSRAVSRFLDLATVSYSGAHLERFDETYLETTMDQFSIPCDLAGVSIVLARQPLRCLSGYLRDRPVWVFQVVERTFPLSSEPLYVSAAPSDFADIFGPVWQTTAANNSSTVLKYNVGKGYIVPWRQTSRDPALFPDEVFCHWTEDVEDLERAENFPQSYDRLLIGAFLTRNRHCHTTQNTFTREMRARKLCRAFGTTFPTKYRDGQTTSVGITGYGIGMNYGESYKIREGVTLKDAHVAAWTSKAEDRDIEIIKDYYGVEISACTDNARRRTLFQILQSSTMRRYLEHHTEIETRDLRRYFTALDSDNVDTFIRRYKRHREPFAKILGKCFEVLKRTGTDSDYNLTAFWVPEQGGTYAVQYSYLRHKWTGILADSPYTCTFAIVTETCLELYGGDPGCQDGYEASSYRSILETSIVINQFSPLPVAFDQYERRRRGGHHHAKHALAMLPRGYKFDLGDAGSLRMLQNVGRGLVVDWSLTRLPAKRALKTLFRSGKIKVGSAKWHNELVSWFDRTEQTVPVLIASEKGMDVIVAGDHGGDSSDGGLARRRARH